MKAYFSLLVAAVQIAAAAESPDAKILGSIDMRPSWTTKSGAMGTENTLEAGYQFSKKVSVTYAQGFLTNLKSPDDSTSGLNLQADLGFLRAKVKDIAQFGNSGVSLSYQPRVYLPTSRSAMDKGMITAVRNYLMFSKDVVPERLTLSLMEIPVLYVFDKPGVKEAANPVIENRVYVIGDVILTKSLSLSMPIMFHQTKYSDFQDGAVNNAAWGFFLWTNPELTYALSDTMSVGLSYYSDNLVKSDLSALALGEGLENGVLQTVFTLSL